MKPIKTGTKEYNKAYKDRSIATYDPKSDTYNTSIPLPEVKITPRNNLDLGQVVRNGTGKWGKAIGNSVVEAAALHPVLGVGKALVDFEHAKSTSGKVLAALSAYPAPIIHSLLKPNQLSFRVNKVVTKPSPGITRIALKHPYGHELGNIEVGKSFNKTAGVETIYPEYIKVNDKGKGLSKALYAAAMRETKMPLISGEVLLQPEKTVKTYKYFDGPILPPLIREEGYNYPRKLMSVPKNNNLYENTIKEYERKATKYNPSTAELWEYFKYIMKPN